MILDTIQSPLNYEITSPILAIMAEVLRDFQRSPKSFFLGFLFIATALYIGYYVGLRQSQQCTHQYEARVEPTTFSSPQSEGKVEPATLSSSVPPFCAKRSLSFPEPGGEFRVFLYDVEGYAKFYSQEAVDSMGPTIDQCAHVDNFPYRAHFVHSPAERATAHGIYYNGPQYVSKESALETFNRDQKAITVWHEANAINIFPHPYIDIEVSLRLDAEVPFPYGCGHLLDLLNKVKRNETNRAPDSIGERRGTAAFISNCNAPERQALFRALMKHTKVFSYGSCLHNVDAPVSRHQNNWEDMKRIALQGHRAILAWENVKQPEYITEKIYDALSAQVVPIYWGSNTIKQILPEGSYIDASPYTEKTVHELAAKLKRIDSDDAYYRSFFEALNRVNPSRK